MNLINHTEKLNNNSKYVTDDRPCDIPLSEVLNRVLITEIVQTHFDDCIITIRLVCVDMFYNTIKYNGYKVKKKSKPDF